MSTRLLRRTGMALGSQISSSVIPARPLQTRPTVSVVVLCYNYGHYLPAAVDSVLSQSGVDVDVVIVDDASPDGSGRVVSALADAEDRVTDLLLTANLGPVGAFNAGLERARGDYIVRLDADDLLAPGALARATAVLEAHPEVAFAYGRCLPFTADVPSPAVDRTPSWTLWSGEDWLALRCRTGVNCITSPEVVMRASTQRRIGGQCEQLGHTHDLEMWLRAARHGAVARVNEVDQAYHRVHPESRMHTLFASGLADLKERDEAYRTALAWPTGSPVDGLLETASRVLALESIDAINHAYERRQTAQLPVQDYVGVATRLWPAVVATPVYRRMRQRMAVGPRLAPYVPTFFAAAGWRSLRARARRRYWEWSGL